MRTCKTCHKPYPKYRCPTCAGPKYSAYQRELCASPRKLNERDKYWLSIAGERDQKEVTLQKPKRINWCEDRTKWSTDIQKSMNETFKRQGFVWETWETSSGQIKRRTDNADKNTRS